jgi:hypothetical protein
MKMVGFLPKDMSPDSKHGRFKPDGNTIFKHLLRVHRNWEDFPVGPSSAFFYTGIPMGFTQFKTHHL